ncbi:MAG: DUF4364 family protein [Dorea sp.]|jgi:DNA-binding PadR family transcriptional regulator|nr:DUF4364 family protein [Dorea sp.]
MAELLTLYKLIILYMLDRVDFPLSNSQISDFMLNKEYTTYFKLQQALSELADAGFIREEPVRNRTLYNLTDDGASTIGLFRKNISQAIRQDVNDYLKEKQFELKNEVSVKSDYYRNTNREYSVRCQVIEGALPLIDLTITVPSEEEAKTISKNWYQKNQEIYAQIMASLL